MSSDVQDEDLAAFDKAVQPVLTGPKRQHYLPRFYLEGFTRDGLVAVYDRESNETRRLAPNNTAVIGHYYTVTDDQGQKRFEIEKMLSDWESKAAPVIKKLIAAQELTEDERCDMAIFISLGMLRTPDLIDSMKEMNGDMVKWMAKHLFADVDSVKANLKAKDKDATDEELTRQAEMMVHMAQNDLYRVETNHRWAMGMSLDLMSTIAPILAGRDWLILHRDDERRSFVTTDAPLVLTTMAPRESRFWGVGFGNADALVIFPIAQSCVLVISGDKGDFAHGTLPPDKVREINFLIASHCKRYVIARDEALVCSLTERLRLRQTKWQPKMRAG